MTTWSPGLGDEASAASEHPVALRGLGDLAPEPWRAAETRLYPLVVADPELYEAAVTLVREAAEVLRARCRSVADLAGRDPSDVLDRCPSAQTATASGVDPGTAVDAARACVWRELTVVPGGRRISTLDGQR